jgi:molecular chaperone DnaK
MSTFGCDLGNSRTKIAQADRDGRPVIVPNALGELYILSVVHFPDDGEPVVGSEAVNMAFAEPQKVVFNWKRHMGTDKVLYRSKDGKEYRAKDIAALILKEVKRAVEARTGVVITELTVTTPANYTEKQKAETIEAAESVGLKVLCLPTEPTAAALGNDVHLRGDGLYLIFDLGGGTFDVSLLRVRGNLFEVLHTNGDPELGGQDVNRRIREHILQMFKAEHGYVPDLATSPVFYADMGARIEQVKITLTTRDSANVIVRDGEKLLNRKVTRQEVEGLISDLVKRSITLVTQTLSEAKVDWKDVTAILPVGGGSRMPAFIQELERVSGQKVSQKVEPDYAAALGAVVAARVECQRQGRQAQGEAGALPPLNLFTREVTSHPLGVSALNSRKDPRQHVLLAKGTPYPSTQVRTFALVEPRQTEALIIILEGDDGLPEDKCVRIGEFELHNLPPYADVTERIEVTFELDASGLLTATARDLKSGRSANMKIAYKSNGGQAKKA